MLSLTDVAPFAGAWIETNWAIRLLRRTNGSLPSRERGLKLVPRGWTLNAIASLPSRERGLKRDFASAGVLTESVAPFAGAWIETKRTADGRDWDWDWVAPFAGAWIETSSLSL